MNQLTQRERQAAELVGKGLRNKQIACQLGISEGTVKVLLHSTYDKLGISSRVMLAILLNTQEGA